MIKIPLALGRGILNLWNEDIGVW